MNTVLIETQYLPPISYFTALQNTTCVILEKHENFVKQSYRNRCFINATHGKEMLTIPLTGKHGNVVITSVRIDYTQKWLNNHWRSIQSAYGKAPFFEYYAEDLHELLFRKFEFIYDLNYHLLSLCLKWLKKNIDIKESMSFEQNPEKGVIDLRNAINAKNYETSNKYYHSVTYYQVFGNKFVNNLSILDLIFCTGPQANQIVQASTPVIEQI